MKYLTKNIKKIFKVIVSFSLIIYLILNIEIREVWHSLIKSNLNYIFWGSFITFIYAVIGSWRWMEILKRIFKKPANFNLINEISFISRFYGQILPSSIGGDISKLLYAQKLEITKKQLVTSIIYDRVIGLLSMLPWLGLGLLIKYPQVWNTNNVLIGLIFIIFLFFMLYWLNKNFHKYYDDYFKIIKNNSYHWLIIMIISILNYSLACLGTYFLALSLGITIHISAYLIILPISQLVMAIPFSINGIGLREVSFVNLLSLYHVNPELSVSLSMLSYGTTLLLSIIGGGILLYRNYTEKGENFNATLTDTLPNLPEK